MVLNGVKWRSQFRLISRMVMGIKSQYHIFILLEIFSYMSTQFIKWILISSPTFSVFIFFSLNHLVPLKPRYSLSLSLSLSASIKPKKKKKIKRSLLMRARSSWPWTLQIRMNLKISTVA